VGHRGGRGGDHRLPYWVSGGQVEQVPATALQVGPGPGVGLSLGGAL
jgi:hypothetical protein